MGWRHDSSSVIMLATKLTYEVMRHGLQPQRHCSGISRDVRATDPPGDGYALGHASIRRGVGYLPADPQTGSGSVRGIPVLASPPVSLGENNGPDRVGATLPG